jgi:hypothetical protein
MNQPVGMHWKAPPPNVSTHSPSVLSQLHVVNLVHGQQDNSPVGAMMPTTPNLAVPMGGHYSIRIWHIKSVRGLSILCCMGEEFLLQFCQQSVIG